MRVLVFSTAVLLTASTAVAAPCIEPATLAQSAVSITREFGQEEQQASPGVAGIRGTGWFLSPRLIVTAAHVAEAMHLSSENWKSIEIKERDVGASLAVRILRVAGERSEKIAVLELQKPFTRATVLGSRMDPLVPEEILVSVAYPNNKLRTAGGRFVRYGDEGNLAGLALLEMHDGNDRLVLDHGASGAPVLDCKGRVVAVVSTLITQTLALPTQRVRISTAWQTPNVISIPIDVLKDFAASEISRQ